MPDDLPDTGVNVLWLGTSPPCWVGDGLAWHEMRPGHGLTDVLERHANVLQGKIADWNVVDDHLHLNGRPLHDEQFDRDTVAVAHYKNATPVERRHLSRVQAWLEEHEYRLRVVNPAHAWELFDSKAAFLKHASLLPKAHTLVPRFRVLREEEDVRSAWSEFGDPLVLKVDNLSGGVGTTSARSLDDALRRFRLLRRGIYDVGTRRALKWLRHMGTRPWRGSSNGDGEDGKAGAGHGTVLAMEYVDTFDPDLRAHLNCAVYFWGDKPFMAVPRVSIGTWNVHARDMADLQEIGNAVFERANEKMVRAVRAHREELDELRASLPAWPVRFDCLVTPSGDLFVVEPELKWGAGPKIREQTLPSMETVGYGVEVLRSVLDLPEVDPLAIVRANGSTAG